MLVSVIIVGTNSGITRNLTVYWQSYNDRNGTLYIREIWLVENQSVSSIVSYLVFLLIKIWWHPKAFFFQ